MLATAVHASPLKSDERIIFFPTLAYPVADAWKVHVHGWIHEPEWGGSLKRFPRELSGLEPESPEQRSILRQRLKLFLVDNERGKEIQIRMGRRLIDLPPSLPNGHFQTRFRLAEDELQQIRQADTLPFVAVTDPRDTRQFQGTVHILDRQGLSVISDIDDTIKLSGVLDKRELLANVFLRPFEAVRGMSALYQAWASQEARFHYVSASPWQLYPVLWEFMHQEGFPAGSFHLRTFRLKDASGLEFLGSSEQHKFEQLSLLFKIGPQRRFILVGDTGEKDPEIYAKFARAHPDQVESIFLHNVSGESRDSARFRDLFPDDNWRLFDDATALLGE